MILYACIAYIDYKNDLLYLLADIFYDISMCHVIIGLEFLSFHTYKNAQISLRLKVNKNESFLLQIFFTSILAIIIVCIILKNIICPYYNSTHYLIYYYAIFSVGLILNLIVCWYFFVQLNNAISEIQTTLLSEHTSSTADNNPLISFKRFLTLMTIILVISLSYTTYYCIVNIQKITTYYGHNHDYIPYNGFISIAVAMSVTYFFWQSPKEVTPDKNELYQTNRTNPIASLSPSYGVNIDMSTPTNTSL